MLSIYCFISCPPLVGHINQTAMGDILLCALIYPTATFISHSSCGEIELGWCPPSWHLSTAPRWPSRWSSVISWLSHTWGYVCVMCVLYASSFLFPCSFFIWILQCSIVLNHYECLFTPSPMSYMLMWSYPNMFICSDYLLNAPLKCSNAHILMW